MQKQLAVLYEQKGRSTLGSRKHEEAIIFFIEAYQLAPEPEPKIPRRKTQNEEASKQNKAGRDDKKAIRRKNRQASYESESGRAKRPAVLVN